MVLTVCGGEEIKTSYSILLGQVSDISYFFRCESFKPLACILFCGFGVIILS